MGLFRDYVNQTRKPEGFLGKLMLGGMNSGHAKLADWGMENLPAVQAERIADLGCGGGRNLSVLLEKYPSAKATGVDYSALCVEKSRNYNRSAVDAGRCQVVEASVASLPLEADAFDLATAFETIYFWPGLETCFGSVYRILKPGGLFLIVNESDGTDAASLKFETIIEGMKTYTPERIREALDAAGFSEITTVHHPSRPWIAVTARKTRASQLVKPNCQKT